MNTSTPSPVAPQRVIVRTQHGTAVHIVATVPGIPDLVWCEVAGSAKSGASDGRGAIMTELLVCDLQDSPEKSAELARVAAGAANAAEAARAA